MHFRRLSHLQKACYVRGDTWTEPYRRLRHIANSLSRRDRRCHSNKSRPFPSDDDVHRKATLALFNKLFPDTPVRLDDQSSKELVVPELELELEPTSPINESSLPEDGQPGSHAVMQTAAQRAHQDMAALPAQTSVLVLNNASLSLTRQDFDALLPRGKHMESWKLEHGDITNVVPGRDPVTLDRKNFYYLFFKSPLSAFVYQGRATRISRLAWSHAQKHAPLPAFVDGENALDLINSYTLTPPSQQIVLRQLSHPPLPMVETLIERGGYPRLVDAKAAGQHLVMLRLEGPKMTSVQISNAIEMHERRRNLAWQGDEPGLVPVQAFVRDPRQQSTPVGRRVGEAKPGPRERHAFRNQQVAEDDVLYPAPETMLADRYLVTFEEEAQAHTFVRYWHRRSIMHTETTRLKQDASTLINAEVLW